LFVTRFLELNPKNRRLVINALCERYKPENGNSQYLLSELDWLTEVVELLNSEVALKKAKLSGVLLSSMNKRIGGVIEKLNKMQ